MLGSGGMAEVYAAVNVRTERRVALKWILPALAASPEVLARFRREALAAGRINHPNVVTIFDVVEHQSSACLVMEMLSGETLADRMKRTGQMAFVEAVALMLPAMRGVAAAHFHGVIHRDLKPDNIFLCMDADGSIRDCKVLDFGVSKLTVADAATTGDITLSGNVVGTPEYMAPEQVRAGKHADHRIDIYSLGVVFYEMLAGRPPFVGEHFSGLMLDIMQRDPPPLSSLRQDVPRRLAGVIHRALARDLTKRFADMPTFIMAVEAVGRDELKLAMGTPAGRSDHADRDAAADARRAVPRAQGSARIRRGRRDRTGIDRRRRLVVVRHPGPGAPAGGRDHDAGCRGGAGCRSPAAGPCGRAGRRTVCRGGGGCGGAERFARREGACRGLGSGEGWGGDANHRREAGARGGVAFVASLARFGAVGRRGAGEAVHEGFREGRAVAALAPARQGLNPVESKTASW